MNDKIDKIIELLKQVDISEQDKDEFLSILKRADIGILQNLIDLAQEDVNYLVKFWENYKSKETAFILKDSELLNNILNKEVDQLENLD